MDSVILVDENDQQIGEHEKMDAHVKGLLHRAFSVFIFNSKGEMLLQQRASSKYHSPNLWTNACCSHPQPGEQTNAAAMRRLGEELGFVTHIEHLFSFVYRSSFDNGLTEHEFDHVFKGIYDGPIKANEAEVQDFKFLSVDHIREDLASYPEKYTAWFRLAFPQLSVSEAAYESV